MKPRILLTLLLAALATPAYSVVHWFDRQVGVIMPPDFRDCVFFKLDGVNEPDPVSPNSPWIAVPRSHHGFKEIYAFLLWAKGTGTPITVETSSQQVSTCGGFVGIWQVYSAN